MARTKIDYGIDLGTTNSAICRMEKGIPKMKRSDIQKDIMPSCVSVNRKGALRVGEGAYSTMKSDKRRATKSWRKEASNTYIEFKRTMATDKKYECGNLGKSFTSEELSAEVLKTLKSFVTDENVNCAIITVPAKFSVNQKTATLEAAKMAGFRHRGRQLPWRQKSGLCHSRRNHNTLFTRQLFRGRLPARPCKEGGAARCHEDIR